MIDKEKYEATLTNITYFSSHDGPGMRITLFFKGCLLKCLWCHNPETISRYMELTWDYRSCIKCHMCSTQCRYNAILIDSTKYNVDKEKCVKCFSCVEVCPALALKKVGRIYSLEELKGLIDKDLNLFNELDGGVTFSGGEPTLQSHFIVELAKILKKEGVHLALDTSGYTSWENLKRLLPYMDLILYDIKEISSEKHMRYTGVGNELILDNILRVNHYIQHFRLKSRVWIRTPLIPDMTDSVENIRGIGAFLKNISSAIDKWELCAFNNLCKEKYRKLGVDWVMDRMELIGVDKLNRLYNVAKEAAPFLKEITISGLGVR